MASINSIQLKNIEIFAGSNEAGFEADIYMNDIRIGEVAYWGDNKNYDLSISPEFETKFEKRMNEYFENINETNKNPDFFIDEIHTLIEQEKRFKKESKKYDKNGMKIYLLSIKSNESDTITCIVFNEREIDKILNENEYIRYTIFKNLKDFNITING